MSKQIPEFKNEDEEREFWATHDSTEYINWNKAKRVIFSNLKPSVKKISSPSGNHVGRAQAFGK